MLIFTWLFWFIGAAPASEYRAMEDVPPQDAYRAGGSTGFPCGGNCG